MLSITIEDIAQALVDEMNKTTGIENYWFWANSSKSILYQHVCSLTGRCVWCGNLFMGAINKHNAGIYKNIPRFSCHKCWEARSEENIKRKEKSLPILEVFQHHKKFPSEF